MTNRATLQALLARVVQGTRPDRELDAEIACAVNGFTMHEDSNPGDGHFAFWHGKPWDSLCSNCSGWPPYTASLDSALTLVPEGYWWQISNGKRRHHDPQAGAELFFDGGPNRGNMAFTADAATPPLALIAACLKARMDAQGE